MNKLVQSNVLTPDDELERHLRQIGGLPVLSVDLGEKRMKPNEKPELLTEKPVKEIDEGDNEKIDEKGKEKPAEVKKVGHAGYRFTDKAQLDLENLWDSFCEKVLEIPDDETDRNALIAAAIVLLAFDVEKILKNAIQSMWIGVRGDISGASAFIEDTLNEYMGYFGDFIGQLKPQLLYDIPVDIRAFLQSFRARVGSYSGAVWRLYNESKLWLASPDAIWEWRGPNDERTCKGCREEIEAGPRPLREIYRRPGMLECLSNCRCELFLKK